MRQNYGNPLNLDFNVQSPSLNSFGNNVQRIVQTRSGPLFSYPQQVYGPAYPQQFYGPAYPQQFYEQTYPQQVYGYGK